ncbi:GNAT family N-acetyltransferase [Rariglobus hedericola]|uniref:GNAT family N-acetyltransferase n=1 Tax=Rariglobus hedericola TaxID=2597822 RepID=A0A556QPB8_9BACT|nr:GNAT family N-acyltransferase [Rariglobus hedericola]TSJ78477.1 GNAT family N-acetyltransferase [Rariglobus hedericola]
MNTERYELRLAKNADDVRAAQRLRFAVFNVELGEGLPDAEATGLDADEFDAVCDHLLIVERETGAIVGTYRLQTGVMAGASRLGYYSAREFDFAPFEAVRSEMVELGRACVAAEHRNQSVLGLLWRGIAQYAQERGARYLVGCSSLTSQDAAEGLAAYAVIARGSLVAEKWRTRPLAAWRCEATAEAVQAAKARVTIPRLMMAYLAAGAAVCGEPAIDREFKTIDFLTWMDLQAMPARVLRKFMG